MASIKIKQYEFELTEYDLNILKEISISLFDLKHKIEKYLLMKEMFESFNVSIAIKKATDLRRPNIDRESETWRHIEKLKSINKQLQKLKKEFEYIKIAIIQFQKKQKTTLLSSLNSIIDAIEKKDSDFKNTVNRAENEFIR
ncbi:hypothetical protein K9L97_03285 [Candidatus Woesearchaeota archaeon]|nr:hypothetical protein [Candidatus Woesearchaeota archaeon]